MTAEEVLDTEGQLGPLVEGARCDVVTLAETRESMRVSIEQQSFMNGGDRMALNSIRPKELAIHIVQPKEVLHCGKTRFLWSPIIKLFRQLSYSLCFVPVSGTCRKQLLNVNVLEKEHTIRIMQALVDDKCCVFHGQVWLFVMCSQCLCLYRLFWNEYPVVCCLMFLMF